MLAVSYVAVWRPCTEAYASCSAIWIYASGACRATFLIQSAPYSLNHNMPMSESDVIALAVFSACSIEARTRSSSCHASFDHLGDSASSDTPSARSGRGSPTGGIGSSSTVSLRNEGMRASTGECSPVRLARPVGSTTNEMALSNQRLWPRRPAPAVLIAIAEL